MINGVDGGRQRLPWLDADKTYEYVSKMQIKAQIYEVQCKINHMRI